MAERQRTEISAELLGAVRDLAERQGRPESAVLEEAVMVYLLTRYPTASWREIASKNLGADIEEIQVEPPADAPGRSDGFLALLGRMGNRFDLDEEEAERLAVEEQHAWRREQSGRDRAER